GEDLAPRVHERIDHPLVRYLVGTQLVVDHVETGGFINRHRIAARALQFINRPVGPGSRRMGGLYRSTGATTITRADRPGHPKGEPAGRPAVAPGARRR